MEHPTLNDRMAQLLATSMLATSAAFVLLFPDMEKLVVSPANFALCGLALLPGRAPSLNAEARRWEQVVIATWLVTSPWVLGFEHVAMSLWITVACAVLLFLPAAWMASRQEVPRHVEVRSPRSQWRRPF
ncbi:SPW repeat protein [Rhizobium fabae]|uniref:SPW repeat-containing protein n=1 Tax=Rhizobium fabae TaxID=573179 RepID=A0A7W6BDF2_9HYPH|nr:SPW repeat protein [Rhizobium fabae]MBB3917114.1 hypothetical protein [Rhizobium fabae]RUM10622.1 hypothetical protein EFB14_23120 [Rhizobium fabae]